MSTTHFQFIVEPSRSRYTEEELLAGLRRYAAIVRNRPFRADEFERWKDRPFTCKTVQARFGSWRQALRAIGLSAPGTVNYDSEKLIADLERIWRSFRRAPSASELAKHSRYPIYAYASRWGSVRKLCLRLAAHHRGELTREKLINDRSRITPRSVSTGTRWRILERDNFRCVLCGRSPSTQPSVRLQVDHIVPALQGGSSDTPNLRTLCQECNLGRRQYKPNPRRRRRNGANQ